MEFANPTDGFSSRSVTSEGRCSKSSSESANLLLLNVMKFRVPFYERLTAPNVATAPHFTRLFTYSSRWRRYSHFMTSFCSNAVRRERAVKSIRVRFDLQYSRLSLRRLSLTKLLCALACFLTDMA